jgi:hypothetical protein
VRRVLLLLLMLMGGGHCADRCRPLQ